MATIEEEAEEEEIITEEEDVEGLTGRTESHQGRIGRNRDASKVTCFRCDKLGHFAANCPDRLLKLHETTETKEEDTEAADALMMHEIVYLNERNIRPKVFESSSDGERVWNLDNSASNHMTGDRSYFQSIDETITGKVSFGDDSRIDIKGKGSILFLTQT